MFFPGFGGGFPQRGVFEQAYRAYPVTFIDKKHLENGDKVILPASALDQLASLHIDYPMLFEVHNRVVFKTSHCGVLEFTADEGIVYMPYWMMQNLLLEEGSIVHLKSATLPKGTYVKLQPHTKDFLDISNPKAVLETTLRSFSCLTQGDNIMVAYNSKNYYIDIVETRPSDAISIIETDCEVDFAPPLDYVEPPRPAPVAVSQPTSEVSAKTADVTAVEENEPPKVVPFVGTGRRLDGKPSKFIQESVSPAVAPSASNSSSSSKKAAGAAQGSQNQQGASGSRPRASGKLVFGGPSRQSNSPSPAQQNGVAPTKKKDKKVEEKEEEKKENSFKAFSGKGYSLKG